MLTAYHVILVGTFYLVTSLLFYMKNRSNQFDKGQAWMLFSMFHGLDELADGIVQLGTFPELKHMLENIEFTTFFLSSAFLLIATLVKINWINRNEILTIGFLVQFPAMVFFLSANSGLVDTIESDSIAIGNLNILYFTIIFGLIPTLLLAFVYIYEFLQIAQKKFPKGSLRKKSLSLLAVAIMLVLYNLGELLGTLHPYFLYLEVIAIAVILMVPVELNLGNNKQIQMFMIYHEHGFLVHETRLNTSLTDDTIILVTGFLSAVNTLVKEELKLGELEKIETGNGLLYLIHDNVYIYSLLVDAEDQKLQEKLFTLKQLIQPELEETIDDIAMGLPVSIHSKIEHHLFDVIA